MNKKKFRYKFYDSDNETKDVKSLFKRKFEKAYKSKDIRHPLFNASKTEAKRLVGTSRGRIELKRHDPTLIRALEKWTDVSISELKSKVEKWITNLKLKTGETKTIYRKPGRVHNTLTKSGNVNRPLALIHMDLADVARLNPDNKRYRYPFILVVVDAFSNFTVLIPIKSKSADRVLNGCKNAFSQLGLKSSCSSSKRTLRSGKVTAQKNSCLRKCMTTTRLQTDRGTEFINKDLKKFLRQRGYDLFSSRGSGKAYLAESKIGQMKRQLVRIQNILEDSSRKHLKRKRRSQTKNLLSIKKKAKKNTLSDEEYDDTFEDFKEYQDDWSKHMRKLQNKINDKVNSRTGFTPRRLFEQFTGDKEGSKKDIERREMGMRNENETTKKFEPINDTITKMVLLRKGQNMQKAKKRKLNRIINQSKGKGKDPNLSWKRRELKVGDQVHLTYSRIKGYPNEKPLNVFEKKSTQTKSEWNTDKTYVVDKVLRYVGERELPVRYKIKNKQSGKYRKTLYYREELLLKKGK